ncbi:Crp/Fnr family transcriptional regulator [Marivirga sp. S37H4]|uniref:Crp/Fnr family transcriptional regulator n=1 Tax=Marivirga aurantiaca TaxID=2802615 RepID=A0A935C6N0_9BACT|nr:Crp/Fnr family transcriptional regulator [Marivirga aurantiaca]MBK6263847.1 Crp/Fnr family transcriptional regulator [Marivirga aurantiaca]
MNPYIKRIKDASNQLNPEIFAELEEVFVDKKFSKGAYLLRPGQICSSHLLIKEGIARKFYFNGHKEITTEIYFHDDVAVSLDSYIMQKPGDVFIEALTELEVTIIDYGRFHKLTHKYPEVMMLDKMFIEYYAVWFEQRLKEFQTMDASQRYLSLLEKEPKIIRFLPVTIIASFLNVSLETLSRIRSKMTSE